VTCRRQPGRAVGGVSGAIAVRALALIPGTSDVLAGSLTHGPAGPASNPAAVILEYTP
jgi:hypothetical protein